MLVHGRPLSVNWVAEHAAAVVDAWYPGDRGGTAVAEVLFGDYNPGGKLAVSVPKHVGQIPVYYYHRHPRLRYVEMDAEPLYPFGWGLSYTTFEYRGVRLGPGATATVRLPLGPDQLCCYGADARWVVEPGTFTVMVGGNSTDLPLTAKLEVRGARPAALPIDTGGRRP